MRTPTASRPRRFVVGALLGALGLGLLAGCSSSSPAPTTTASTPHYDRHGPYAVGVATLKLGFASTLGERLATVFYPGRASTAGIGRPRFHYAESQTLPPSYRAILPARYDAITSIAADDHLPVATSGPFPIVLFSHGFGGERLVYSHLLAGIASWGYVVVSADYLERGIAAQAAKSAKEKVAWNPALDVRVMASSLKAIDDASSTKGSLLYGVADPKAVAAVGHSQGGQTAYDFLKLPHVLTAVGWEPAREVGTASAKPTMLIGTTGSTVVPPSYQSQVYDSLRGPRSWVKVSGEGHNTYTDICPAIQNGGGLISFALSRGFVSKRNAQAGTNGCSKGDIPANRFWPIVQYYTVFQLKAYDHPDAPTVTVPAPAPGAFPGFTVTVRQAG